MRLFIVAFFLSVSFDLLPSQLPSNGTNQLPNGSNTSSNTIETIIKPSPSFEQTNCADSKCSVVCPNNCSSCSTKSICTGCAYGYFLRSESCLPCPQDCKNCTLNPNFPTLLVCNSSGPSYFIQNSTTTLSPCSPGCVNCNSYDQCLSCQNHYYLKFNGPLNFSCELCSINSNCSTCFFSNETKEITSVDYMNINDLVEFQQAATLYSWDIRCLSCLTSQNYTRKENSKCYLCSDLIQDCLSCSYGNSTIQNISGTYVGSLLIFAGLSAFSTTYQPFCMKCISTKLPSSVNSLVSCLACNSLIANCFACDYGYLNSSGSLLFPGQYYNSTLLSFSTYQIRCLTCNENYGLSDSNQTSCTLCSSYCEYCYYNSTKSTMVCGRCFDYYVLNIYDGTCSVNTTYIKQLNTYQGSCLKIVSENPWYANLSGMASNYLCQKCSNSSLYPSINGYCVSCANSTCSSCSEASDYLTQSNAILYTSLLKQSPLSLISTINSSSVYSSYQRCSTCSSSSYGYNSACQFCCNPNITMNAGAFGKIVIINRCSQCSICDVYSGNLVCSQCSACNPYNKPDLADSQVSNAPFTSNLFGKRIYYILKMEASTFSTIPTLNDTSTYNTLYDVLIEQKFTNFAPLLAYECSACPISYTDCYVTNAITQNLFNKYKGNVDLSEQISYLLAPYGCKTGFVYDSNLNRCKFCPNNWTSCKTYKRLNITFSSTSNLSDPYSVTSFLELQKLFQVLESESLSFILNEFAVEVFEIYLLFPSEFILTFDSNSFQLTTVWASIIPSLTNFSLILQPISYDSDKSSYSQLHWEIAWDFSGFYSIVFNNIIVNVLPSFNNKLIPGFTFNSLALSLVNCSIQPTQKNIALSNNLEENYDLSKDYKYEWQVDCSSSQHAAKIEVANLTINVSIYIDSSSQYMFLFKNIILAQISDVTLLNLSVEKITIFQIGSNIINMNNIKILNCTFNSANILISPETSWNLENLFVQNSSFYNSQLNYATNSIVAILKNMIVSNSVIYFSDSSSYFIQTDTLVISNVFLSLSHFHFSKFFEFTSLLMSNVTISDNLFISNTNSDLSAIFLDSTGPISSILFFNISFISNTVGSVLSSSITYFFNLASITTVIMSGINFVNNGNSSLFCLDTLNSLSAENVSFLNNELNISLPQNAFLLSSVKISLQFTNCYFENISTNQGLINVNNWRSETVIGLIIIKNLFLVNIYYNENKSDTGAGFYVDSKKQWNITLINATFINSFLDDQSDYEGSAVDISVNSITSSISIINSSFSNFTSTGQYGAIFLYVDWMIFENCQFGYANFFLTNNLSSITKIISEGPFLNLKGAIISIANSNFTRSYGLLGGAIYISNSINKDGTIHISNCKFTGIYSLSNGGVLFFSKSGDRNSSFAISNCVFQYIFALGSGGILYIAALKNSLAYFENCLFSNFDSHDGSIFYEEYSTISLKNSTLMNNSVWYIQPGVFSFFSLNSALHFNFTSFSGTLFSCNYGSISLLRVTIANMISDVSQPAVSKMLGTTFLIESSNFCNVSFFWSGFYLSTSAINISTTSFFNLSNSGFNATDLSLSEISPTSFVYLVSNSKIEMYDSFASSVNCFTCTQGNFLYSMKSYIMISNCSFDSNFGYSGGVLYAQSNLKSYIYNCSFTNNEAFQDAGNLYIINTEFIINYTNFSHNSAIFGKGGAIYYSSDSNNNNLYIVGGNFLFNYASMAGAIYYQKVKIQISSSTIFANNSAAYYGTNLFSYPAALRIIDSNNQTYPNATFNITGFRSGGTLPNVTVQLLDEENNPMTTTKGLSVSLTLQLIPGLIIYEKTQFTINQTSYDLTDSGVFVISYLNLVSQPSHSVNLLLSSSSIKIGNAGTFTSDYTYSFSVSMRNCIIGEKYDSTYGTCTPCDNGFYSFYPDDGVCKKCLEGLTCDGYIPLVNAGYWREKNLTEIILPCTYNYDACVGGNSSGNNICLEGHIGARCESCDLMGIYWEGAYSRSSNKNCLKCDDMTYNYIILVLVALVNFASMAFSIVGALKEIEQSLKLKVVRLISRFNMLKIFNNESSIYIKIYLAYFQIVQVISTFKLTFPSWSQQFLTTVGNPTDSSLYSTDCVIRYFNNFMPYIYIKLFIALVVPVIYLLIFSIGYVLFISRIKVHRKYSMLYTASLFTFIYFQPTVIQNTIGVLSCVNIGDVDYIKADVAYLCNTTDYWFYSFVIGIPSLLLWGLLVPLIILWRLIKNRKHLNEIRMKVRYGYIYQEYRLFYWEFVKIYEKLLVTMFLQFYENDVMVKGLLILTVVSCYLVFLSFTKPYKSTILIKVDQMATTVIVLSILLAVFSYDNPFPYLVNISYVLIIIFNLFFNVFMIVQIMRTFSVKFDGTFNKLRKKRPFKYFLPKPFQTLNLWRIVRRAVAKYLRERERRSLDNDVKEKKMNLSLEDYDPEITGVKRKMLKGKLATKIISDYNEENSPCVQQKVYKSKNMRFLVHHEEEISATSLTKRNEEIFSENKRDSTGTGNGEK